jgi:multidrug efflux pump subunit AcrA (membrane-fusion protein)
MRSASYELPKTPVEISYRVSGRDDVVYQWQGHLSRYEGIGLDAQSRTVPVRIMVDNPREVRRNGQSISEDGNGGLPALVRGMFVDVAIKTKPKQSLILVPKLAVKPGGQVWRFDPDPAMLIAKEPSTEETSPIQLHEWEAGRLRILNGINSISLIRLREAENAEFWVVEAREDLIPGTRAIVSPLANIIGDGNDKVRISTAQNPRGVTTE